MKLSKKKELAEIAYLYYIEGLSQAQISEKLGVYRTSINRMLTQAKKEGIVKITIDDFDEELYQLETFLKIHMV